MKMKIQSTLALRTPRYYGHPANTDSSNPQVTLQTFLAITELRTLCLVPTTQFYRFNSSYNGQRAQFLDTGKTKIASS